jgi:hypothetical protein
MKRVALTARGATVSFLMDELTMFGDALGALIDSKDGLGEFTDEHMEALSGLHSKLRAAVLLASGADVFTADAKRHLTDVDVRDMHGDDCRP